MDKPLDKKIFLPLLSASIFYLFLQIYVEAVYSLQCLGWHLFPDWMLQVLLGYLLFAFSRKAILFLLTQFIFMGIFYIGNAIKISLLGSPITIDDIYSFGALYNILNSAQRFFLVLPLIALLVLFLINLKIKRESLVAVIIIALASSFIVFYPRPIVDALESRYKFKLWRQLNNYQKSGAAVYLLYNGARFSMERLQAPDQKEVEAALAGLRIKGEGYARASEFDKRDVIIIIMEGLWDVTLLERVNFSQDPFDPGFRALWDSCGNSWVLSPVYGGHTANTEFEVLSGQPANLFDRRIMFHASVKNKIPALPRLLSECGYESIALHPYIPTYWNRLNAYHRLGFDFYYSIDDFKLDDINEWTLSDKSLYRQSWQIARQRHKAGPKLLYILTLTGHWPFLLDPQTRPTVIECDSQVKEVASYANSIRYSTQEIMEFIKVIRREDPDALLVILGDHIPMLGANYRAYVESGLFIPCRDEFTPAMYRRYASAPLIIIDGKKGPVRTGTIAMYEIPGIIFNLLGSPGFAQLDMFAPVSDLHIRTLAGVSLVVGDDDYINLCKGDSKARVCRKVSAWLGHIKVLSRDILIGKQFSLRKIDQWYKAKER
ncbi:MAG: LTA synthase family protein [Candidatus Omnitrophica bacterium]|nr:LTA synthase family protein [Candidatus Omnitrophota bacterium]